MTKRPLSPAQQLAINAIKEAKLALVQGKATIEQRIREETEKELAALDLTYALAVRRAKDLEVPIARIGEDGMGTSDKKTVHRWLAKTARMVRQLEATPGTVFSWEDASAFGASVRVNFPDFPTTSLADDYPAILAGVVREDSGALNGWAIVEDPLTIEVPGGHIPGHLTWEIESVPKGTPGSLTALLDAWVGENR